MSANTDLAQEVVLALLHAGVRECCIAAGARNLPLLAVLSQAEARGKIRLWHFFEERCAGFFALGRIMVTRQPVAVVTTSGTAAAELLPAIIEAHYQGLPLIAVTADRPPSWRDSGAPQAINQLGIYADYAGPTMDLHAGPSVARGWWNVLRCSWNRPCHVNVCFDEPRAGDSQAVDFDGLPLDSPVEHPSEEETAAPSWKYFFAEELPSLVLVGGLHPSETKGVISFLKWLGWPIVLEATANLHPVHGHRLMGCLLEVEQAFKYLRPRRVLRIGSVPHWRWWRDLEDKPEIDVIHFTRIPYSGLARPSLLAVTDFSELDRLYIPEREMIADAKLWYEDFLMETSVVSILISYHPASEISLLRAIHRHLGEKAVVYLGNSMPIREWHLLYSMFEPEDRHYYASRGANGIDGQLSTFFGVAAEAEEAWGIFGDLTTLYDLAGPWILQQNLPKKLRLVVVNNAGGDIFTRLPSVRGADGRTQQLVRNPHQLEFGHWAQMWGMDYLRASTPQELEGGLPTLGAMAVIELAPDPTQSAEFWRQYEEIDHPKPEQS